MDPFHERLARVALAVAATYGFALAGGYAIQAHGFLDRPSADVDLFAEASAEFNFPEAVDAVIAAYQRDGLDVRTEARSSSFARLIVSTAQKQARVELGVDWRMNEPIRLAIGPVLHTDDAVANKVCALFGRAEIRDYVDVAAILASGRYSDDDLIRLASQHDPGFDLAWFTEASKRWTTYPTPVSPNTASTRQGRQLYGHGCTPGRRRSTAPSAPTVGPDGRRCAWVRMVPRHPGRS